MRQKKERQREGVCERETTRDVWIECCVFCCKCAYVYPPLFFFLGFAASSHAFDQVRKCAFVFHPFDHMSTLLYLRPTNPNSVLTWCMTIWIGLILLELKTYYWNHCSKIIFKCVNSTVRLIFNEKIAKK